MRWPFGPPHLTLKPSQQKNQKKQIKKQKQNKNKKTSKEGLGPSEVALRATSHDPSTLQKKHQQKKTKQKKQKKIKKEKKTRKNKKYSKMSFSVISENFLLFWVGVQNFPFLTTWPKKRAPKKHYKNRGFSKLFFGKHICVTKRPFLDQKNLIS